MLFCTFDYLRGGDREGSEKVYMFIYIYVHYYVFIYYYYYPALGALNIFFY